jgi:hypothetical protein
MRYNYDFNDPVDRFKFMEDAHNEIVNRFLDGLLVPHDPDSVESCWVSWSSNFTVNDPNGAREMFYSIVRELGGK